MGDLDTGGSHLLREDKVCKRSYEYLRDMVEFGITYIGMVLVVLGVGREEITNVEKDSTTDKT